MQRKIGGPSSGEGEIDLRAVALRTIRLIDLTSLGDNDEPETIEKLCQAASTRFGDVAAVCVWPRFVAQAVQLLEGTNIAVAAVANFPDGENDSGKAIADALAIVEAGGHEVDVVVPWRGYHSGEADGSAGELVARTRQAVGDDVAVKAILETGELRDPAKIRQAADDALRAGADFLKTSTGKTTTSATPEAARTLLEALIDHSGAAGLKVSGGVRTVAQAAGYLAIADEMMGEGWVSGSTFRFGASSLLEDVLSVLGEGDA